MIFSIYFIFKIIFLILFPGSEITRKRFSDSNYFNSNHTYSNMIQMEVMSDDLLRKIAESDLIGILLMEDNNNVRMKNASYAGLLSFSFFCE